MNKKKTRGGERGGGQKRRRRKKERERSLSRTQDGNKTSNISHYHTTASLLFLLPRHPLYVAHILLRALVQSRIALTALPLPLEEAEFLRFGGGWEGGFDSYVLARASAVATSRASDIPSRDGRCWRRGRGTRRVPRGDGVWNRAHGLDLTVGDMVWRLC